MRESGPPSARTAACMAGSGCIEGSELSKIFDTLPEATYRDTVDTVELGTILRVARQDCGLSQGDLARLAGLSRATINYAEHGRVSVGSDSLLALMKLLNLRIEPGAENAQALRLLAQTASVSYRDTLPVTVLANALRDGVMPERWTPHIATMLDEAPDSLLLQGIREVARRFDQPTAVVWRHAQDLARETLSTNPRWRHVG